jgi:mannose-6-phosphate isomerase-like protein (cupin superfamily)
MFFVLAGMGIARAGDVETVIGPGDAVVVKPGHEHVIQNTGEGRLYTLTVMIPNEGFAELIRSGLKASLDAGDLAALRGQSS